MLVLLHYRAAMFAFPKVKAASSNLLCHMPRADIQGRKTTFMMLAFKIQTGLSELSLTTRTQTHIVKEIIINLVTPEPREQPIAAETHTHTANTFISTDLTTRVPPGRPNYSQVILHNKHRISLTKMMQ